MREEILELLEEKKYPQIAALVKDINPADAAALLEDLPEQRMPLPIWTATPRRFWCAVSATRSWTR